MSCHMGPGTQTDVFCALNHQWVIFSSALSILKGISPDETKHWPWVQLTLVVPCANLLLWDATAHLDLLWDSGVNAMCFSSQISSSSEPPSSNCCIRSLQHASNRAIFPYRKKKVSKRENTTKIRTTKIRTVFSPNYQWKLFFFHLLFEKGYPSHIPK